MKTSTETEAALKAEFPKSAISWRAQSVTKDGSKALALAYIDARDVMNRLDEVVGMAGWQDSYTETTTGRLLCTLSILLGETEDMEGVWFAKSDGAGNTDVEGEKGAISDAFKRAAVKWGIGRYLYDMDAVWVPCESYQRGDKWYWSKFKQDPWDFVRNPPANVPLPPVKNVAPTNGEPSEFDRAAKRNAYQKKILSDIAATTNHVELITVYDLNLKAWRAIAKSKNDADEMAIEEIFKQVVLRFEAFGLICPADVQKEIESWHGFKVRNWLTEAA